MSAGIDPDLAGEATNWKARLIAFSLTVVGVLGAGLSTNIKTAWIQNTALALATTLVSTGALSLLFELSLRRSVSREILSLVGISKALADQHIIGAGQSNSLSWTDVFRSKSDLRFALVDPSSWVDQNIAKLLEGARQRKVQISFYIPDHYHSYCDDIADSLGSDREAYRGGLAECSARIERAWKSLKTTRKITPGSKLFIRIFPSRPQYSLALCDDITVLIITSLSGREGADYDYFYLHGGDRGNYPSAWFRDQILRLDTAPIRFSDEV